MQSNPNFMERAVKIYQDPNQGSLALNPLDPKAKIINPSFELILEDDVHDVDFKHISLRSGPLANRGAPESNTTKLARLVANTYGSHISITKMYDHFLLYKLPKKLTGTVIYTKAGNDRIRIEFSDVKIMRPSYYPTDFDSKDGALPLTPRKARLTRDSYAGQVYVSVTHYNDSNDDVLLVEEDVHLFDIPIMLGSVGCYTYGLSDGQLQQIGECPNDTLGYFIHGGTERVFKNKENIRYNIPATYVDKNYYETRFTCYSSTAVGTTLLVLHYYTEGKSPAPNILYCRLQHFNENGWLNIFTLFRILGWNSERALQAIVAFARVNKAQELQIKQKLAQTINVSNLISDGELFEYIASMRKERADSSDPEQEMLTEIINDLFSNISGTDQDGKVTKDVMNRKLHSLAFIVSHTIMFILGIVAPDDRNAWSNKKILSSAGTIESAVNSVWCGAVKKYESKLEANSLNISVYNYAISHISVASHFVAKDLSKKVFDVFSPKGKNPKGSGKDSKPIAEQYRKITPIDGTSTITKTTAQTSSQNKKNDVRVINKTQLFYLCLSETPENANIGVVKNLAYACWLSLHHPGPLIQDIEQRVGKLWSYPFGEQGLENSKNDRKPLFVNGELYGFLLDSDYPKLRALKYSGYLAFDSCVHYNPIHNSYEVFTTDTRPTAPMLTVDDKGDLIIDKMDAWGQSIDYLLKNRCLEWLDARELEYALVAQHVDDVRNHKAMYNYSCIQTNMMAGWAASITPWQERNKGPRNIYQAAMSKQALNGFSTVHNLNYETSFKILNYTVRPICEANTYQLLGMESMPNSQNVMMAILSRPDNNEDALEVKEESLRGQLFRVTKYITIKVTLENGIKSSEILAKPQVNLSQAYKYTNISDDGLPRIGSYIKLGDCIIGKLRSNSPGGIALNSYTGKFETSTGDAPINVSKFAGVDEEGYVTNVLVLDAVDGEKTVHVKLRQMRMYECGDKLALRYSQKGTVGNIIPAKDMPTVVGGVFDGLQVDYMFSTLSIPTRMTASLLLELISGIASLFTGERVDCTSFEKIDIDEPSRILRKIGREKFNLDGEELDDFSKGLFKMARPDGKIMGEWRMEDGKEVFYPSKVAVGPISPQVLRHHVADKFQVRRTGSVNILNRQGRSGRSRHGALRFGEMESDAVKAVGGSHTLIERMKTVADEYKYFVCTCGADAISIPKFSTVVCSENKQHGKDGDSHSFGVIKITYISLLIKRLLAIAGINMRFFPKPVE